MSYILPVVYPPITSFPDVAQTLSILFTEKERVLPWFMTHYMQLTALHPDNCIPDTMNLGSFLDCFLPIDCEGWEEYLFPRDIINKKWGEFTDFLISCLNLHYYIQLSVNMYHFPCSPAYHTKNYMHFPLIYGYNQDTHQFLVGDFYKHSKYSFENVPLEEMELAYQTATFEDLKYGKIYDYVYIVKLFKYTPAKYIFNISEFLLKIRDYVNAMDSTHYQEYNPKFKNYKYVHGVAYYDAMADYINNYRCETKALHVLCDHKQSYLLRLDYLAENQYIRNDQYEKLKTDCDDLYKTSLIIRNKYLKQALIKKNNYCFEEIASMLLDLKEKDINFCNQLLYYLENRKRVL